MLAFISLFFASLLSSTLLPISSEITLIALLYQGHSPFGLWLSATIGNTLGACINAYLGHVLGQFKSSRYVPINEKAWHLAEKYFKKYGIWSLLFSWLPIIGDALTFAAGIFKVNPYVFIAFVMIGKAARYAVIVYLIV